MILNDFDQRLRRLLQGDRKELRRFALPAIGMGLVFWGFTSLAAVSHFIHGAPIRDKYSGDEITIGQKFVMFGGGALFGTLLIGAGIYIFRASRKS